MSYRHDLMQAHIRSFTAALDDPLRPTFCSACLAQLFGASVGSSEAERRNLRLDHPRLFSASVAFILATSAPAVQPAVEHQLRAHTRSCRLRYTDAELRQQHRHLIGTLTSEGNILHNVIAILCGFIFQGLLGSFNRLVAKQRFSRNGLWPQSTKDLLPTGPELWLQGMSYWMGAVDRSVVIDTFEAIFLICRPELQPLLLIAEHRDRLVGAICAQLDNAAADAQGGRSPANNLPSSRISAVASLLQNIILDSDASITLQFCTSARRILDSVQGALDHVTETDAKESLVLVGNVMLNFLDTDISDLSVHPSIRERKIVLQDAYQSLHQLLRRTSQRLRCSWTDCGRQERELGDSKLRVCSRCHVLKYCGSSCQKEHWRSSHKAVCQTLSNLFAQIGLEFTSGLSEEAFAAACRATSFDIQELSTVFGVIEAENAEIDGVEGLSANSTFRARTGLLSFPNTSAVFAAIFCLQDLVAATAARQSSLETD